MSIICLHQGVYAVGGEKKFKRLTSANEAAPNMMVLAIQPFLLKVGEAHYILLDAGLEGNSFHQEKPDLLYLLEQCGVPPSSVKQVILSHLHYDHFSGLFEQHTHTYLLPHAQILVYKPDFEHCLASHRYPAYTDTWLTLKALGTIHFLEQDNGSIGSHIHYFLTGGHTPFHIVFKIYIDNHCYFYGGDEAPQLSQMKYPLVAKYDYDGKKANQLRQQWFAEGREESWYFLFYHDIKTPIHKAGTS